MRYTSATDFAVYVLDVDQHLRDARSSIRAETHIFTLAMYYDSGVQAKIAAHELLGK